MAYLYITSLRITNDSSSATRILSFCKMMQNLGKEVLVISLDDVEQGKIYAYQGVSYRTLRSASKSSLSKIFNHILHSSRLEKVLINDIDNIEGIFFYSLPITSVLFLKRFSKKYSIKLFHDSVEWYSWQQFKWGIFAMDYISKNILNKYLIDKSVRVFSISSYLNHYYLSKGIATTRVPIFLDISSVSYCKKLQEEKIKLVYAGAPGKKDYLKEAIEGLSLLNETSRAKIEFFLYGVDKRQLIDVCGVPPELIEKCGKSLNIRGKVAKAEVQRNLIDTDFTVLLRSPNLRYAKAGFPTKVVESLSAATPVICNITSDLGDYLIDGVNSYVVDSCSSISFKNTLEKVLVLTFEEKNAICINARRTAEINFDYRIFKKQFNSFICEK